MANRKYGEDAFAVTMWKPEDVQTLREHWSIEKCREWLEANERYVADRLVELGWDVIEALLPAEERSCATCCHNVKGACEYDGDCDAITHPKWNRNCGEAPVKTCATCTGWVTRSCIEAEADGLWDGCNHWGTPKESK
jgi:hypothetical protein